MHKYNFHEIEKKWQERWEKERTFKTEEKSTKPKLYVLDMFPYPSGEGLHVGHPKGYIATDIYSRYMRMRGHNVLHPMGWDAFGLPAENFALKNKVHPRKAVEQNIATFKQQLAGIGFDYDWSREINTTDPAYYKWTQWIFLQLFKRGLAYQSNEPINWCPSCMTGLANEDLDGTVCERCGSEVEKKSLPQWVLKITAYADRMLADLSGLKWPEHIKEAQRNWIGRSEGAEIEFALTGSDKKIKVFTTRPDTLFGATYMVLAPEHPLVLELGNKEVQAYVASAKAKTEIERSSAKEKTGVNLGVFAINPATQEKIPVYVADYVLWGYGTGAIMAVPAHDERDFAFAKKFNLPITYVVHPNSWTTSAINSLGNYGTYQAPSVALDKIFKEKTQPITDFGTAINSGQFNGRDTETAKKTITEFVGGKFVITYKIKDWVFSRQRYWGEPIPIIHCAKCGPVAVPEKDLPVLLPEVTSYEPSGTGESPLANIAEWVNTTCPECGGPAKRETNTMPQWAGSSWYYLRFMDPHNDNALVGKDAEKYWAPVDVYVGGDHAVRHLIYARFWHKFLFDIGVVSTQEPFARLEFLGFILAEDGRKMSKRYGNVINPTDVVTEFGADTFRVYEMFMGPFENTVAWSQASISGTKRFIERVWKMADLVQEVPVEGLEIPLHQAIKKVGEDIESFKFNTAVSQMMIFLNAVEKEKKIGKEQWKAFLSLLTPFAPHVTNELAEKQNLSLSAWPSFDEGKLKSTEIQVAVQVNGKVRGSVTLSPTAPEAEALAAARAEENVSKWLAGGTEEKAVYVPGRIISFKIR